MQISEKEVFKLGFWLGVGLTLGSACVAGCIMALRDSGVWLLGMIKTIIFS